MFIFVSDEIDKTQKDIVMKKITKLLWVLLIAIALPQLVHAQGWTRTLDYLPTESAQKMTATANGHVLASATSSSYSLLEVDSLGHELWYKSFSTPFNVSIREILTLSTGEIVLMGIIANGSNAPGNIFIAKHTSSGTQLWFKTFYTVYAGSNGYDLLVMPNDTLLLAGHILNTNIVPNEVEAALYKLDSNGDSVLMKVYQDADTLGTELHHIVLGNNNTIVACGKSGIESSNINIFGFDYALDSLWQETTILGATNEITIPRGFTTTSDGGSITTGYYFITGGANGIEGYAFMFKADATGGFEWNKRFHLVGDISNGEEIIEYTTGKYALLATALFNTGGNTYYSGKPYLVFTDGSGNEEFHKVFTGPTFISLISANDIKQLSDKGFLMCGSIGQGVSEQDIYLIRTDSLGNAYKAVIAGNIFGDSNENCQIDGGELALKQWIVTATGVDSFYAVSDANGNYAITCDTGTYALRAVLPSAYWVDTLCSDSLTAAVSATTDTLTKNIPIGKTIDCPALKVSVDAPFLRRCLPGPAYVVSYCNNGTAVSANTYAEITLDSDLVLDSASIAYTSLGNNKYRFDIGAVGITDCGSFLMYIRVDCSVAVFAQSHCVEADIFPNTVCTPPSPLWDGARLDLTTDCQADSLAFLITNTGNNMSVPRSFTIIQDDVMYAQGNFNLYNLQLFTYKVPSNGSTWTFVTEQTPFFPGNKNLVGSFEGCGTNNQGVFSLGYLVQYPQIGPFPSSTQLCLIDRASFDPNDKAVEPKGLGLDGTIDKNQHLNYRIRFQNTGTDTAFLVVILDTLSQNLDLLSIRNVRSSHPMQMTILPGRILQFTFANILLPDSNVNEQASHGYVSFEIDLIDDLYIGTEITNTAFIYFDQNQSVITNTTLNTIGELFKTWLSVTDISNSENRVAFYPNPTQGLLNFSIAGDALGVVEVSIIGIQGQQLFQKQINRANEPLQLDLSHLPMGVYLLKVKVGNQNTIHRIVVTH